VEDFNKAESLTEELQITYEFFKEGDATEDELDHQFELANTHIENLEFRNMLSDEGDSLSAVLQITAGAGGTESCDWASMLMRMYLMWAENQGYKVIELNFQEGDVACMKTVTLEIEGDFAFGIVIMPISENCCGCCPKANMWSYLTPNSGRNFDFSASIFSWFTSMVLLMAFISLLFLEIDEVSNSCELYSFSSNASSISNTIFLSLDIRVLSIILFCEISF